MYSKRVAFLISKQHLIPHGGIGQFAKGFVEMCGRIGFMVDIITDSPVQKSSVFTAMFDSYDWCRIVDVPNSSWEGTKHSNIHAFKESLNFERVLKFRDSLMAALQYNLYDCIVVNTPEALFSVYALGIQDYVNVVFYTHNENLVFKNTSFKGVFNDNYDPYIDSVMRLPGITIGTQTERNVQELDSVRAKHLPMPIPERGLLNSSEHYDKTGVLFIGRWEERKNPKEFVRVIKETGLPAKVMTNRNGALKFRQALMEIGATFEIRESIIGEEKVDFIKGARVFFMPSKSESFGFALMESIPHAPSVVLSEYEWHSNFDDSVIHKVSKNEVSSKILDLYTSNVDLTHALDYVRILDSKTDHIWKDFIESFTPKKSNSNTASITKVDDVWYDQFIAKTMKRYASIEDIISIMGNSHRFSIFYNKNGTYMTKNGTEIPETKGDEEITLF